jgi:hypothetical protein
MKRGGNRVLRIKFGYRREEGTKDGNNYTKKSLVISDFHPRIIRVINRKTLR